MTDVFRTAFTLTVEVWVVFWASEMHKPNQRQIKAQVASSTLPLTTWMRKFLSIASQAASALTKTAVESSN